MQGRDEAETGDGTALQQGGAAAQGRGGRTV